MSDQPKEDISITERALPAHDIIKTDILMAQRNMNNALMNFLMHSQNRSIDSPRRKTQATNDALRYFIGANMTLLKYLRPHFKNITIPEETQQIIDRIDKLYENLFDNRVKYKVTTAEWLVMSRFLDQAIFDIGISDIALPTLTESDGDDFMR